MRLTLKERFRTCLDQYLVDPWDTAPVVLAVSGGSDSTALMHLAADAIDPARLYVLTVDHGLRDVSAEIALVATQAKTLGLAHHVLTWEWDGQGNLQAAARDGRWSAIEAWCDNQQADVCCLTGHTRDDQAETVLMRLARGSGVAGLSGMGPVGRNRLRVVRPLLNETRADLRDWLTEQGSTWSDDPSNDDRRFDRVKARAMQAALSDLGLTTDRLVQTASHMQSARREMAEYAALIAHEFVTHDRGDVLFPLAWPAHRDVAVRLFRHALHYVGGGAYPPRSDASLALWHIVQNRQGGTLHGCQVSVKDDTCRISREAAATPAPHLWSNRNFSVKWDNRWLVSEDAGENTAGDLSIRALGKAVKDVPDWRESGLPRASLIASPAVFRGETLVAAPVAGLKNGFSARIVADLQSFLLSR